ncbi:MAG: tRNA-uridine aminocarboxypropyltransferase [Polyangiales bacterium]
MARPRRGVSRRRAGDLSHRSVEAPSRGRSVIDPRASCARCLRPVKLCWCEHLTTLDTKTRVVLLQHPKERDLAIGTARMATLCLPNSELHVGVEWSGSAALNRALSDPERPAALLYPGPGAIDVLEHPPGRPITLVVIDGTWWQTRNVLKKNPALAALPRYAFRPPSPSDYRIRREPHAACVSTIEALTYVLGALEGSADRFRAMLKPFHAMIDAQIECEKRLHAGRLRKPRGPRPPKDAPSSPLRDATRDVVCLTVEANAWPRREDGTPTERRPELVQWVAHRVSTGESVECVVCPRNPIGPGVPSQTGLTREALAGGITLDASRAVWRAFVREGDRVRVGRLSRGALEDADAPLAARVDLRKIAGGEVGANVGAPGDHLARLGGDRERDAASPMGQGRAGRRARGDRGRSCGD